MQLTEVNAIMAIHCMPQ